MALGKRFIPHACNIKTAGAAVSAWINEIESYGPDQGVELFEESGGSETDREFVAIKAVTPKMPIVTKDLSFLGTCGFSGIPILPDSSNPGLVAYGREVLNGALPTALATADHLKMIVSDGLLVPVNIRAAHNQAAVFNLMLHATLGTTPTYSQAAPMLFSTGQAIATGAAALSLLYTAGPVKFNSTLVKGIVDLAVDFGLGVEVESDSGDVYPSFATIKSRMPKIMFTTKDSELIAAIGDGLATTTFAAYFRKIAQNGQRVAVGTAQHISVAGTLGMITPGALGLQHKSSGSTPFTFTPSKDTVTITISTSASIPTS